ncbi:hypothetical protein GALMADRAFT_1334029 [Galerina marginata CBS 339.88]|uniref:G-protein coupled receptors family 1 profile domain-containing protein n=1 Tax=Galerina marginata (strain CBS 339.88) TaxID=685588 RepID=A0A067T6P3_GALM3|nr:hypothetical protein GALMADRAFT_1334029 [Galerina marginata CBS 339.88]
MVEVTGTDRVAALFVGSLAHGVYLSTFAICIRWLLFADEGWKFRKRIDWTMLSAMLALFVLSSTHIALAVSSTAMNIGMIEKGIPPGNRLPWSAVVMCVVANSAVLIADAVLIYRCWIVCAVSLRIVSFPCLLWLGGFVCTVLQLYWQVVQTDAVAAVWTPVKMNVGPGTVLLPFWTITLVLNLYATGMIIHRIWRTAHKQSKLQFTSSPTDLQFVIRVLTESGALYLVAAVPHFIVWWTRSNTAILIMGWTHLPITCTAFNLILIRTSQHRADDRNNSEKVSASSAIEFTPPSTNIDSNAIIRTQDDFSSTRTRFSNGSRE